MRRETTTVKGTHQKSRTPVPATVAQANPEEVDEHRWTRWLKVSATRKSPATKNNSQSTNTMGPLPQHRKRQKELDARRAQQCRHSTVAITSGAGAKVCQPRVSSGYVCTARTSIEKKPSTCLLFRTGTCACVVRIGRDLCARNCTQLRSASSCDTIHRSAAVAHSTVRSSNSTKYKNSSSCSSQ